MDSDLWISHLAAAKRHYASQLHHNSSQSDRTVIDEFEVEEEIRPEFPCPYCYEDHDVTSLCAHLEEEHPFESKVAAKAKFLSLKEHPFESKVAVCPVCSDKVTKDMLNHITLQHGHLFKSRRRLRRFVIPSSQAISLLGRDLREAHLQVLLGNGGYNSNNRLINHNNNNNNSNSNNTAANIASSDPLLSSLVLNFPVPESGENLKSSSVSLADDNSCVAKETPSQAWRSSFDSSLTFEEREQKRKQAAVRATFVRDLLLSTLFSEL